MHRTMQKAILSATFLLICSILGWAQQGADSSSATAGNGTSVVPRLIRFSGTVHDSSGSVVTGSVGLTFSLYQLPDGGQPLWVETQTVTADSQGHYTVLLGANSPDGLPLDLFARARHDGWAPRRRFLAWASSPACCWWAFPTP